MGFVLRTGIGVCNTGRVTGKGYVLWTVTWDRFGVPVGVVEPAEGGDF
jgi:hypothetical protein